MAASLPRAGTRQRVVIPLAVASVALAVVGLLVAPTIEAQPAVTTRPTAVAAPRDLRVTTSVSGALARSDTTTIAYGGPRGASGAGSAGVPAEGGGAGGTPAGSRATAGATQSTPSTSASATITALLDIGAVAGQGSQLYRADDEPVVSLLADTPLFRDLTTGVSDGPDVRALEQGLVEMGSGDGVIVDETFDDATAAAVRSWEEAIGRATPDGSVSVGEVVFLAGPAAVLAHSATIGVRVEAGSPVLTVGTESQVVDARVDATEIADWTLGSEVDLRWVDDSTEKGTVVNVGRDESDGQVAMVVALAPQEATRPIGTAVEVIRVTAERRGVLAVPVSAVVQGPDGPSVRPAGGGGDRWIKVELGVVADHWVEIANGLDAGAEVALPG